MKKITQDLFHEFNFLSNLAYTADGKVLFVKTVQNVGENSYESHIFQLKEGKVRQLTSGKNEQYFIMEDPDSILFLANRSEDQTVHSELYRLDLKEGGEASLAYSWPLAVNSIKDLGSAFLVSANTDLNCPEYHLLSRQEQLAHEKIKEENQDYQIVDEYPFFFNGAGFINKNRSSLYLVDKKTSTPQRITPPTLNVESFDEENGIILMSGIDYSAVKGKWAQIYQYDIGKGFFSCLYPKEDMIIHGIKHYQGKIMVIGTFGQRYGVNESAKLWFLEEGEMKLFIDKDMSLWNSVGTDSRWGKGKSISKSEESMYLVATIKSNAPLMKIEGSDFRQLTDFSGVICDYAIGQKDIVAIAMVDQKLQEIYRIMADGSLQQLSFINEPLLNDYYVAKPEKLVLNKKPMEVEGWVLKPFGFDPDRKYPAILDIHGGPRSAYGELYYHEMQYWASCGFIVMYCNPRGSDGYGNEFADIRREKYGTIDYEDIMDFTDEVLRRYPVDERRLAVAGGSYGGFMTNWIIGHTNRFCCAVSQRSISNWMSMMLASDYGLDVPYEHGFDNIHDCAGEIWRVSPLKYADNVRTPTLFIHSFEDYRCPYPEGLQMFTAIRALGVEARMCLFKGENHELSRSGKPKHRSRRLKEITYWIISHSRED